MKNEDGLNAMVCAPDLTPESIHEKMRKAIDEKLYNSYSAKLVNTINPVLLAASKLTEDKQMKTEKIVDLWHQKSVKALMNRRDEKTIKLINEDPMHKELMEQMEDVEKRITKQFGETEAHKGFMKDVINQYYVEDFCTEATDEKIKEANDEFKKHLQGLRSTAEEVKTMLKPCEQYYQEILVLVAYGIVENEQYLKITI